ncbi:HAD-IIA family hydrolase [Bacillus sp. NPDC077027]|uniref:HAD-IIA family hydrolase n=1 Tax=Bacillus sp. NPDC077027 TaxID=3390548 RepID=UPI003CFEF67D
MIANEFDVFLFDLDGVIYIGDEPVHHAVTALDRLRRENKQLRFLTNDPCATREMIQKRLNRLGFEAYTKEIITASVATAQYLKDQKIKTAFILGNDALYHELHQAGIQATNDHPEAVIVGWDDQITFADIRQAVEFIYQGALFIAASADLNFPTPNGPAPGAGAITKAITAGCGQEPLIIGKPAPAMFETAISTCNQKAKCVMIGDNPLTDIMGAHQAGIPAILVSAEQEQIMYPSWHDARHADAVISNLASLFDSTIQIGNWLPPSHPWADQLKAGVAGWIMDDTHSSVLLLQRADNGKWGIPSGHVEPGESIEEAIIREIKEETGLTVKVDRLIGVYSDPTSQIFTYPNGQKSHFVTIYFACTITDGTLLKQTNETLDAAFFKVDALPENLMTMHPNWLKDALANQKSAFIR